MSDRKRLLMFEVSPEGGTGQPSFFRPLSASTSTRLLITANSTSWRLPSLVIRPRSRFFHNPVASALPTTSTRPQYVILQKSSGITRLYPVKHSSLLDE